MGLRTVRPTASACYTEVFSSQVRPGKTRYAGWLPRKPRSYRRTGRSSRMARMFRRRRRAASADGTIRGETTKASPNRRPQLIERLAAAGRHDRQARPRRRGRVTISSRPDRKSEHVPQNRVPFHPASSRSFRPTPCRASRRSRVHRCLRPFFAGAPFPVCVGHACEGSRRTAVRRSIRGYGERAVKGG